MRLLIHCAIALFFIPFSPALAQDCTDRRDCVTNARPALRAAEKPPTREMIERLRPARDGIRAKTSEKARIRSVQDRVMRARPANESAVAVARKGPLQADVRLVARNGQTLLEQQFLKEMKALADDPKFTGVMGSIEAEGVVLQLERRDVLTDRGILRLTLSKMGEDYVYDGDLIVPGSALVAAQFILNAPQNVTFAAGHTGGFGEGPLWDDAIIPFEVALDFCCTTALTMAIAAYESQTPFRFVPRDGHDTYIRFENSEPLLSSRTQLGKQQGVNVVKIQGFTGIFGAPIGNTSLSRTIQHEIGHELGLIHEHLRSDRDQFIARNPACTTRNVFGFLRNAWIDVTNVAFTDQAAELLTDYDFDSMMHYAFRLDSTGDGVANCSTWVRIATCPGRNPAAPGCNGSFASAGLTARDIEGLLALYSQLPIASNFGTVDETRTFTADNIRHRGRRVDPCLHGVAFGVNGCTGARALRVAREFCQTFGYDEGFNVETETLWGQHSGFHEVQGWVNVFGTGAISAISCRNVTQNEQEVLAGVATETVFLEPDIRFDNLPVDRCMHGLTGIAGDRCSDTNQGRIADAFCDGEGFAEASAYETDFMGGFSFAGFFPSTGNFAQVGPGLDRFTEITCRN